MLEKIIKLEGVGLFAAPLTKAIELKQATLIYADNGRGKSTLAAVLRACASADAQAMAARATIGGTGPTRAQLRFKLPTGGSNVTFDNGVWDAAIPSMVVFDQTFIERNVYAGGEVHADHHQSLLDFALGTAAVAKKKEVDDASEAMTLATKARSAAENKLQGYRGAMSVAAFLVLPKEPQADEKIAEYEMRIANAHPPSLRRLMPALACRAAPPVYAALQVLDANWFSHRVGLLAFRHLMLVEPDVLGRLALLEEQQVGADAGVRPEHAVR